MKSKLRFYWICYVINRRSKSCCFKTFNKEPLFTHPNSPPLFFEPGSSECFFAKSEKRSLFNFIFKSFKNKIEDFAVSLGLILLNSV